jgi:tetratricopeptide (TPR) repeat protein
VRFWDAATGDPAGRFDVDPEFVGPGGVRLIFSPDGTQLALIGNGNRVAVFDLPSGRLRFRAPGPPNLEVVAFSPDGRRLAGAGRRGGVYLWDADTGQEVLILERFGPRPPGNYGFAARVLFSPDGTRIAANNWDGTVSVWSNKDPSRPPHFQESLDRVVERRLAALEAAIQDSPSDLVPLLERARFHHDRGDRAAADADVSRARELVKDDQERLLEIGRFLAGCGRMAEADETFAAAARQTPHELDRVLAAGWRVSEPCPGDLATPGPAEKDAAAVAWNPVDANRYGLIALGDAVGVKPGESVYVLGVIPSPESRTATLLVGTDGPTRLWVNGRLIGEMPWTGAWPWGLQRVAVAVRPGRNTVLARVARQQDNGNQFVCRLADGPEDRALDLGLRGLLAEAAAQARRVPIGPEVHGWWLLTMARVFLVNGDREHFRLACREMATRQIDDDWIRIGALGPDTGFPAEKLVEGARGAVRPGASWTRTNLGVAEYRAGQLEKAVADLKAAGDDFGLPILAMAHHRLGRKNEALQALAASRAKMKTRLDRFLAGPRPRAFHAWDWNLVNLFHFYAEACRLIHGEKAEPDFSLEPLFAAGREDRDAADPETVDFDLAVHTWPERPRGYLIRAVRRLELKRTEEAAADLARYVDLLPRDDSAGGERERALRELLQWPEALALLLQRRPSDSRLLREVEALRGGKKSDPKQP